MQRFLTIAERSDSDAAGAAGHRSERLIHATNIDDYLLHCENGISPRVQVPGRSPGKEEQLEELLTEPCESYKDNQCSHVCEMGLCSDAANKDDIRIAELMAVDVAVEANRALMLLLA